MSPRESDLLRIYGSPSVKTNTLSDLDKISRGAQSSQLLWYGEYIAPEEPEEHWYDPISSLMQSSHETSMESLNDDNRQDEKEIEILEEASKIEDDDLLRYKDAEEFFTELHLKALRSGNKQLAEYYRILALDSKNMYDSAVSVRKQADELVNKDKNLFTLSGHNPITEAIGEIASYVTEGASTGATVGSYGGPEGSVAGAIVGLVGGLLYGGYDYIATGRHNIDRVSYTAPLSANRNENYANAIKTRQSYKDFRSKQIQDEQEDLLWWQTKAPVSDYYRHIESTGGGNYLYYNLPGIVGSSFSDTKHMGQQAIGSYGLSKLAKVTPNGKWSIRAVAFANALKAGWQASLNENHAESSETATKKTLAELNKNKKLSNEMVSNARRVAMDTYGIDESEAKELIDTKTAFTMYLAGIGGLNPRNLKNGYQYYKTARKLGDNGADTQFERNMMATAGGDVLEAALMVTPYGALANKSKVIGRAIAGAAVGAAAGEFAGFGVPGSIIGGIGGGAAAQIPFARKLWNKTFKTVQQIEDKVLPRLEKQIVADKILHAAGAFGTTALAEAAEEGTQYLNSLDAEKILQSADDDLGLRNLKNLFVNDLKKRGEVFNAVLSQFGLTDSPYQDDQEFWSNWKGGLILGGLMTGAMVSLQEASGIKKAYLTAKYLQNEVLSSAVASRTEAQDAILKGVAFAKYGAKGNKEAILETIDRAKKKNSLRNDTPYSDEDFDKLSQQANRIISASQYGPINERLRRLGYDPESEEAHYALSVFDYYTQRTNQNRKEGILNWAKITQLMSSPDLNEYLDRIVGVQPLNDGIEDSENQFTFNVKQEDGTITQQSIPERERLRRLHQNAAQLIAVTQLLKDLQDVKNLEEYAKNKGIAFSNKQAERSITSLKLQRDKLKNAVEIYSKSKYDATTTSYDQQIEYLKTLLIPVESSEKLVDAYRDSALLMLNQEVYGNIIRSLGLGGEANVDIEEAKRVSHKMTNMFKDNVIKNQQLQEIIDYAVDNNFPGEHTPAEDGNSSATPDIADPGFEEMSSSDIATHLTSGNLDYNTAAQYARDKSNEYRDNAEHYSRKLFGGKKARRSREQAEKWDDVYRKLTGQDSSDKVEDFENINEVNLDNLELVDSNFKIEEEPQIIESESPQEQLPVDTETPIVDGNTITLNITPQELKQSIQSAEEEASPTPVETEDKGQPVVDEVLDTTDEAPVENDNRTDDAPLPDQPGVDSAPIGEDVASAVITEDEEGGGADSVDLQQQAIDNLTAPSDGSLFGPTKLIDGWYLAQDGSIIPSERMYMANPVEVRAKLGKAVAEKYLRKAAEIRFQIHRILNNKSKDSLLSAKLFVTQTIGTADVSIVDPIAKALLKNDQNAVKLLIMHANPRTWNSYYVNEYFRDAFRRIVNGQVVNRPEYIDRDAFNNFCKNAIRYKKVMESRYGWKFVTNYTPSFTEIDGQKVVADPDMLAVDKAGNIHVVDVHTMKHDDYVRWGHLPIEMTNTKNTFSVAEERMAYVDLQIKALLTKPGVVISSAVLLPAVVNNYDKIYRLYVGKMIPIKPSEQAVRKYSSNEDQLEELKTLLKQFNEKATKWTQEINDYIEQLKAYRKKYHTKGYRFKDTFSFTPDEEPTSIAEAYAQLDKVQQYVLRMSDFKSKNMDKEIAEMQRKESEDAGTNKKSDVSKEIDAINAIKDESWGAGIEVELEDAENIQDKKDLLTKGVVKVYLRTTPEGTSYIVRELEYNGKTYKVSIKRNPVAYGVKNGGRAQTNHPVYTKKMKMIEDLLRENPDLVVTIDLRRSYTTYAQKPSGHKPIELNSKESIITQKDIDNLGVLQDDGKIVDIGFYDKKTSIIQSGSKSADAVLGRAPEGDYWQNQMFLVIKQNHAENGKTAERRIAIPLIRSKFNKNIAAFVAKCFKVVADTNHTAEVDFQKKRENAIQLLHLFIGQRLTYKEGDQELPNVVYTVSNRDSFYGDVVRLNEVNYNLHDPELLKVFTKALLNCEIMPRWELFNAKLKNLSDSTFSNLYDHFSTSDKDFHIAIDGVDSGLVITKKMFDNDTLCQWMVKNGFFASTWFVQNQIGFTMHDLTVGSKSQAEVKQDVKQEAQPLPKVEKPKTVESEENASEEEIKKWMEENGAVEIEDEDDEDEDYSFDIATPSTDYKHLKNVNTLDDALKLVSTKYKFLSKLLRKAAERTGVKNIKFEILPQQGVKRIINGVERLKKGSATRNSDGSWTIILYSNAAIKTLAHELVHVYTLGAIKNSTKYSRAANVFYSYCKEVFSKEELHAYGFSNFKEFVAEFFTNPELIDLLRSKGPIDPQVAKTIYEIADIRPQNLWQSAVAFISNMWHKYIVRDNNTAYRQVYGIMRELLKDSYEYLGTDSLNDESITLSDIMSGVVKDIKEKLTKKGYTHKNPISKKKVHFEHANSAQDLREAVDGIMPMWFEHDKISPIGNGIEKIQFSVAALEERLAEDEAFSEWWRFNLEESDIPLIREMAKTRHPYKEGDKNAKYEKEVIERKFGKKFKVKKTFYKVKLENWDAIAPIISEYMSDTRIDIRRKIEDVKADEEMSAREEGLNTFGELLTESYEISPYEKASREVKFLFSTVPYADTSHNKFGMRTFMPFRDVYGKVLYYTANCNSTQEILNKLYVLSQTGPDKEMFGFLYTKLTSLVNNRWRDEKDVKGRGLKIKNAEGKVFDADADSTVIKVIRALRQQLNNFIWSNTKTVTDKEGNKSKDITIRTTLYEKGAIISVRNWLDQLSTGLSGVLKYDAKTASYKFQNPKQGNIFKKIYFDLFDGKESFLYAYDKLRSQDPEDVTLHWRYLQEEVKFSQLTDNDVKTYLHNALLECGIDVRQEVIDLWLSQIMENNPTVATPMDALYVMLSDRNSQFMPINFFMRLATDEDITIDVLQNAFGSGFVKELANLQNEYDLRTQSLMTTASHNNQYYIVSESNYINDLAKVINRADAQDSYIQMLKEDTFAQGSVIAEMLNDDQVVELSVSTFVGMKTSNVGDTGRDYFEIELDEDVISKFELLHEGYMLSPTQSDKKTYHVLRGIPLVGMLIGKRTNVDCYDADLRFDTVSVSIRDKKLLDRFIKYFESEKNAVEKAIEAHENDFYKKNPGKKIVNYSGKNGMRFSSFNCIPLANGKKIYLNRIEEGKTPRDFLNEANQYFFGENVTTEDRREIMARILLQRAQEDIDNAEKVGLIRKNENGLYENIGLDGATIIEMATAIGRQIYGNRFELRKLKDEQTGKYEELSQVSKKCISAAILQYIVDCSIKHMQSMQEYQRLFSGSKSFYKWKDNGKFVTDISVDYTKRRGGDISTGGVNVIDIDPLEGMEELGTYRCIEVKDYEVESNTLQQKALEEQFLLSDIAAAAAVIKSGKPSSQMDLTSRRLPRTTDFYENREEAEQIIREKYGEEFLDVLKAKAKADAQQYFKKKVDDDGPVNVADGATYISDSLCEKLLREEGKWDKKMKYAFEVLRGKHGADVLSEQGADLYKRILNVIVGTQKYTATGFRKSDDGFGGTLMTPYYNKTALFPIFDQIAYGKIAQLQEAMRRNNVDMIMMTSAVKVGSQGAISIDQLLDGTNYGDHTYVQEMRFLRKQLNTDPNEREEMNLGTQTIKIALANLRMNDDYTDPFTGKTIKGKDLYKKIMRSYNILTDLGFELVMRRFCKKYPNGAVSYQNTVPVEVDGEENVIRIYDDMGHLSMPEIDEEALSKFLYEELQARDANDNMFEAVGYDEETDRLAAPLSAISQSSWIDSIIASYINKTVIDTKSPGSAYIQRSVFCMEGKGDKTLYGGKELKLVNDDGSMDAVISIDFFEKIIPNYENMTFELAREWLIEHKLIGDEAKTYTISYRIPTQAQSSINPLKFVDVVPVIRDSIILPKEFTKLTGSDFDIDKLFLSRLFINPDTINNPDQMFTYLDEPNSSDDRKLELLRKGYTNNLFKMYITLLMDKHSAKTKWRPIDADTELWEEVYKDLYPETKTPIESMQQDTISYQTKQKNSFVVGKIGIGPYALNNNNHIYTMLYGISLGGQKSLLRSLGDDNLDMGTLCRDRDIYGNSILSWLSGGINAHVDIAKDPFVTKLNINKYTYNISNFLLRAGFGRNGLWFLNLPVIKELAEKMNGISGQYLKQSSKSEFDAQEELMEKYKQQLVDAIPQNIKDAHIPGERREISAIENAIGRTLTIGDILYGRQDVILEILFSKIDRKEKGALVGVFKDYCEEVVEKAFLNDMVLKDKNKSILYRTVKGSNTKDIVKASDKVITIDENVYNYMAVLVFEKLNKAEAKTTSDLTKFAKIDTKKQGSTVAAQIDFLSRYEQFIAELAGPTPKITGDVSGFFGLLSDTDILGFDTSLMLHQIEQDLLQISGEVFEGGVDITEAGYAPKYNNSPVASFIDNKTKKAINALTAIIRNDSIEGTYGFQLIWNRVKQDFGKSSLTEEAQSKLRSAILGATKHAWAMSTMKKLGIDPVGLFRDENDSMSLAHELVKLKTKRVSFEDENGRKRFGTVAQKYKNNALLNMLFDGHSTDEYTSTDKLIEILDFIKVHVPFTDDNKKANIYIRAWRDLHNDPATKDFAVKLMFYSLLTSNDTGGNNLFKYVPFEMLLEYGLFAAERELINQLGDISVQFAKNNTEFLKAADYLITDIVDRVESILVEDFEFSTPISIETKQYKTDRLSGQQTPYQRKEYTGFGSKFGNLVVESGLTKETDRIPYVFVPVRILEDGRAYPSKTMSRSTSNGVVFNTNEYIRVLNPVANYENSQKYLTYKKIGEFMVEMKGKPTIVPIYQLVDSCMYKLGPYKVYNYNNEMRISSSQVVSTMRKYTQTSPYSIEELDAFIKDAISKIKAIDMFDEEDWSKKEGWSTEYFEDDVLDRIDKAWQIEYELVDFNTPSIGEATMYKSYENNKRDDVKSETTFDAIINGERTATTRFEGQKGIEWWKSLNVGDVITLRDTQTNTPETRRIKVRITRAAHKLRPQTMRDIISPLYEVDEKIKMMNLEKKYKDMEDRVRTVYLPLYDDTKYLEFYLNQHNTGRKQTLSDLNFALNAKDTSGEYLFDQEDRIHIQEMINAIKVFNEHLEQSKLNKKAPKNLNNITAFHMHSGGAYGADTDWAGIAKEWGMPDDSQHISHYYYGQKTPTGNSPISDQDYNEGVNHVVTANDVLNRKPGKYLNLLARNWKQVKESDGIFAIGTISHGQVDGGTGWAVQMAIDAGKQVHVFDLQDERWYAWNPEKKTFEYESTPRLTKNFAGIGTRSIEQNIEALTNGKVKYVGDQKREAALNAMRDVFKNTFGEPKKQDDIVQQEEVKSWKTPLQTAIEKAEGFIGETNGSVYLKQGDKFVLKSGTLLLDALKTITDRGHNPGKWSFGDDYDGQVSYNIGYESGTNAVMSVTNRDLYDDGWRPSTILATREDNRVGNPLDLTFKLYIDQFGKDVTFLVSEKDKPLLEYLNSRGYKYEIYDKSPTEDTKIIKTVLDNGKIRLSLPSHTDEKPRQIVLEPQGDNKYYVHIRIWDGEKIPGKITDEDKQKLFDALYNELPEGAEILLPKSGEGYYATRGTIAAMQRLARDNRFTSGTKGVIKYLDKDGSIKEYEGSSFIKKSQKNEPVFTKVNDAFAEVLIKHLLNDPMPGYETKEKREFLANLARGVFLWIKREKFKVLITNAPYSDVEAGKTSTVAIFASFATIYYQDVDLLGGKYLNILHELLHIVTKQAIPFDSMGRAIADEKMQLYYDMFKRKVMSDPEWKDIQDVVFNPTLETFDKASNRAKILAHAYSDAGEFISCCISNVEVQLVLESITYDETQKSTLFDEIKRWFGELIDEIFRGNEKLSHSNFIEDVTNFLFDVKQNMGYVHNILDSGDFEAVEEYKKYIHSLRERYDNAIDFGATSSEVYEENGKPIVMYRGYALTEDREANSIEETIGHTAVDYDESLKGSIYFTSDPEEAMDYAKTRTDKSDETFIDLSGQKVTQRNRHYTGDFAKVSAYNISSDAKILHYKDMKDYVLNGKNSNADVIILDHGTMWADNTEYIVKNKNVIVKANDRASSTNTLTSISFEEIEKWANSSNGAHAKLIRQILDLHADFLKEAVKEIKFSGSPDGSYYLPHKKLTIPKFYEDDENWEYKAKRKVVLHELIHVLTTAYLTAYEMLAGFDMSKYGDFSPELIRDVHLNSTQVAAAKRLEMIASRVSKYIKENKEIKDSINPVNNIFGSASYFTMFEDDGTGSYIHEFCSEVISNPLLLKIMKDMPGIGTKKSSMFLSFLESIKKILGITADNTLLDDAMASVEELITGRELKNTTVAYKKVSVSTTTYTSESVKNPRKAVVFTENMQAEYARRNNTPSSSTLKVNVTEGTTGTNQAVVRMSDDTTYNPNAFGLIVKKYQQDNHGRWFYDDKGNFLDTDADFTMFKEANEAMFDRLSSFDGDAIVFPSSAAMGKAALPKRFAEWLAQELYERYGLFTVVKPNPKYTGKFGIYIYENTGKINVYSKAGNTNLSNFEARPYRTQVSKTYPAVDVNHVEHAFLLAKAVFANQHGDISDYELFTIQKGMLNASPEECRRIGRSLKMSPATLTEWNKVSSKMLEAQMRRSFNAHPEVTAELLRTGDAKITHNYPNGGPIDERFGPILEKIRSDIRKEQELDKNCN